MGFHVMKRLLPGKCIIDLTNELKQADFGKKYLMG